MASVAVFSKLELDSRLKNPGPDGLSRSYQKDLTTSDEFEVTQSYDLDRYSPEQIEEMVQRHKKMFPDSIVMSRNSEFSRCDVVVPPSIKHRYSGR